MVVAFIKTAILKFLFAPKHRSLSTRDLRLQIQTTRPQIGIPMTLEKFIVTFILLATLAFVAITWRESRADRTRLESAIATQQQVISAAEKREQDRDATLKITLAQIAKAKKAAQTPEQALSALNGSLHLPKPFTFTTQSTRTAANETRKGTGATAFPFNPDSNLKSQVLNLFGVRAHTTTDDGAPQNPGSGSFTTAPVAAPPSTETVAVPSADLKPLFARIQECRSCEAQLLTMQANLSDEQRRAEALAKERDAALKSAKGGNLWHRLRQNAKWLAVGAALSIAASRIH